MRVIVSHDVDHLCVGEHLFNDLFIPKYLSKAVYQFFKGTISKSLFKERIAFILNGRIHRIPELIEFNQSYGIRATFFFGMAKGLGLSYSNQKASEIIHFVIEKDCDVGVHGMAFNDLRLMMLENEAFKRITGRNLFGIRNHYLRKAENTFNFMEKVGYLFDSTEYDIRNPYQKGKLIEFPITMMDSYMVNQMDKNIQAAKEKTFQILNECERKGVELITLNFHDVHFSSTFPLYKEWYMWCIDHLKERGNVFTTFENEISRFREP